MVTVVSTWCQEISVEPASNNIILDGWSFLFLTSPAAVIVGIHKKKSLRCLL